MAGRTDGSALWSSLLPLQARSGGRNLQEMWKTLPSCCDHAGDACRTAVFVVAFALRSLAFSSTIAGIRIELELTIRQFATSGRSGFLAGESVFRSPGHAAAHADMMPEHFCPLAAGIRASRAGARGRPFYRRLQEYNPSIAAACVKSVQDRGRLILPGSGPAP